MLAFFQEPEVLKASIVPAQWPVPPCDRQSKCLPEQMRVWDIQVCSENRRRTAKMAATRRLFSSARLPVLRHEWLVSIFDSFTMGLPGHIFTFSQPVGRIVTAWNRRVAQTAPAAGIRLGNDARVGSRRRFLNGEQDGRDKRRKMPF